MVKKYEKRLHIKVSRFKVWARENYPSITEDNDNGEWCFCDEFYDMHKCSMTIINGLSAGEATEQMIDDLLYVIARDNECETLLEELENYSEWFSLLCRHCLRTGYTNAKWQFAKYLPKYKGGDGLEKLIYDFLETGDEYTERMALRSLSEIYPEQAEKYAVQFWERCKYEYDEYQKIMVLHVLYQVRSPKLLHYLALAEKSEYRYLRENAAEIHNMLNGDAYQTM